MTSRGTVRAIFNYTRDTGVEPEIYFYNPAHGAEGRRPRAGELLADLPRQAADRRIIEIARQQ